MSSDQESIDQFMYLIRHWISDTLSTITIEKSSGKIIGIIVCRFCSIEDNSLEFSRLRVIEQLVPWWNEKLITNKDPKTKFQKSL